MDRALAGAKIPYTIGTMIELPRACVVADRIAEHADFFSFGTNDLTQTTFGLSRDDAGRFLPAYLDGGRAARPIRSRCSIPRASGALIELGVRGGRGDKPGLKVGICGEHGGEPSSVEFCHRAGLRLRLLLAVPGPDRAGRGGARGARRAEITGEVTIVTEIMQATAREPRRSKRSTHVAYRKCGLRGGLGGPRRGLHRLRRGRPTAKQDQLFFPTGAAVSPDGTRAVRRERELGAALRLRLDLGRDRSRAAIDRR